MSQAGLIDNAAEIRLHHAIISTAVKYTLAKELEA